MKTKLSALLARLLTRALKRTNTVLHNVLDYHEAQHVKAIVAAQEEKALIVQAYSAAMRKLAEAEAGLELAEKRSDELLAELQDEFTSLMFFADEPKEGEHVTE